MLLELAESIYEISGIPQAWEDGLPTKFDAFRVQSRSPGKSINHLNIKIETSGHLVPTASVIDYRELTQFFPEEQGVRYVSPWCEGFISFIGEKVRFDLNCHSKGVDWSANIIENALRVMVAYSVLNRGGFMLHSASVIVQEEAVILIGHSGAGKSTCSQFAIDAGHCVISDDINVLLPVANDTWKVGIVPFNGGAEAPPIRLPSSDAVLLKSIYGLCQSSETGSEPVSAASAVARLYASMPFINTDVYRSDRVLERLTKLVSAVPFNQLNFCRTPAFLTVLERES